MLKEKNKVVKDEKDKPQEPKLAKPVYSDIVTKFCEEYNIEYHIKEGTITENAPYSKISRQIS